MYHIYKNNNLTCLTLAKYKFNMTACLRISKKIPDSERNWSLQSN